MAAFLAAAKALKKQNATEENSSIHQTIVSNGSNVHCPFNLDEIFQADIDRFGHLKDVLKFIFEHLERHNSKINEVDMKMVSKFMEISQ